MSKLIEEIKTSSSKWIKIKKSTLAQFHWQNGYGAFSVSQSHLNTVIQYIRRQEEHHRMVTFQEEFLDFLKKYRVPYDGDISGIEGVSFAPTGLEIEWGLLVPKATR